MSKAAKIIAAVVVTVAAVVTGNPQLISAAISMDAGLIIDAVTPKPKITSTGQESRWKADSRAGIPYAVGRCAIAGYQVFQRSAPANTGKFKNYVTVYTGAGPIDAFESFLVNDVPVAFTADSGEGASGYYLNRMWMKRQVGASSSPYLHWTATGSKDTPANHGGMPSEWSSAHQLPGFAASLWGLEWDTTRYSGGTPGPRMVARWVKVYDPRKDSTYPGGSGSHRYADPSNKTAYLAAQATWEWSANPFLHGLMWCLGRYFGDPARLDIPLVKTHGLGAPMSMIEVSNFVECANVAQANNWTLAGEVSSTDDKWEVLKEFLEAGGGEPILLGHKIGCMVNAPKVSLATLTKADAIGDVSVASSTAIEDRINTIWPSYTEESLNWTLVPFDQPVRVSAYLAPDKGERSIPMSLPLVQNPVQMAQLARYRIEDSRELTPIVIPAKPWTMWLRPGDCFTANEPEWGLNNQKVLILQRKRDPATMTVTFVCRTETDGKHAFALGQTATAPDTPALTGLDARIVPPPADDAWTIVSGSVAGPDGTLPGITITGESDNRNAVTIVVDYRQVIVAGEEWGEWRSQSFPAASKVLVVSGLKPGATYQVRVRYITAAGVENPDSNLDLGEVPVAPIDAGTVGGLHLSEIIDEATSGVSGDIAAAQAAADAAQAAATTALANIAAEIARATGAEGTLATSIASLTSTVGANKASADASMLVLTNADISLTASITSLTGTVGANKASADTSIATLTTGAAATAARTTALEAKVVSRPNLVDNSTGQDGLRGLVFYSCTGVPLDSVWGRTIQVAPTAGSTSCVVTFPTFQGAPGVYYTSAADLQHIVTDGLGQGYVDLIFLDGAGATIPVGGDGPQNPRSGSFDFSNDDSTRKVVAVQALAPTGTVTILPRVVFSFTSPSTVTVLGIRLFKVERGQLPYTPYSAEHQEVSTISQLRSEEVVRSSADTALSALITTLTATVGTNTANISANLLTQTSGDAALAASITALTSTVSGNTSAISNEATTRSTQNTALALLITNLTTTVSGNTAAITSEASTRSTNDTALALSITNLTATTSGLSATVTSQGLALVDAQSKLAVAHFELITAAGGGQPAKLGLTSTSLGGSNIALTAAQLYFGDNTVFDDASDTLRTVTGSTARVIAWGSAFGASSNLLEWIGDSSIARSAMTKANAYYFTSITAPFVGGTGLPGGTTDAVTTKAVTNHNTAPNSSTHSSEVYVDMTGIAATDLLELSITLFQEPGGTMSGSGSYLGGMEVVEYPTGSPGSAHVVYSEAVEIDYTAPGGGGAGPMLFMTNNGAVLPMGQRSFTGSVTYVLRMWRSSGPTITGNGIGATLRIRRNP